MDASDVPAIMQDEIQRALIKHVVPEKYKSRFLAKKSSLPPNHYVSREFGDVIYLIATTSI